MRGDVRAPILGLAGAAVGLLLLAAPLRAAPPAGPPYPAAVTGQRVYDYAGIFSAGQVASAEKQIRTIEDRTGAQVAIYTQVKPQSDSPDAANADALALMNQWGVGRKGFDDGLVILFDMQSNLVHGQVSLYAGSGFRAAYLTDSDRQAIFDNDMKPLLKAGDFDGAIQVALDEIDAAATPEHASQLEQARLINAIVGLGTFLLAIWLITFALFTWNRNGRDPIYTSDDSVLMPAPPPGLTPSMATLLISDRTSNRTISAALVDLASQGLVHFEHKKEFLKATTRIGARGDWRMVSSPEGALCQAIAACTRSDGFVDPKDRNSGLAMRSAIRHFKERLEESAVASGWLSGKPTTVTGRWIVLALAEFAGAIPLVYWTQSLDASGGLLGAAGLVAAGAVTAATAYFMPSRTPTGSMLRAMLLAYRRTLQLTLEQSRTMDEVVERRPLPWVTTPDATMAWGVAFDLDHELDGVMHRTVEQLQAGQGAGWVPAWYLTPGHSFGYAAAGSGGSPGGFGGAGMFSASAIPDLGSMVSAIGSIGSTSSGGGGSFGGGGGGGGGGAGGGF